MPKPSVTANAVRLGLVGASGAMGRRVLRVLADYPDIALRAVLSRPGREAHLRAHLPMASDVLITVRAQALAAQVDAVIDFSAPPQCHKLAPLLADAGCAYVVASTGLPESCQAVLDAAAQKAPVLQSANLSLGVLVLSQLVEQAARALPDWDMEIVEAHHRRKVDGPSGTARALGAAAKRGAPALHERVGRGDQTAQGRPAAELGYSVVRGGDVAGEHTLYLFGHGERLELTHRSQSADIFARGALEACLRLVGAAPGRYTMQNLPERARGL